MESSDEENATSKLRISLHLAPGVKSQNSDGTPLEIPSDPIAVPANIRKRGLSAVVNHLLGRNVVNDDSDSNSENEDSSTSSQLPPIAFDFLLSSKLLRLPLESAVRKEGLSTEKAIELQYFPARLPPVKEGEGEVVPDWITSMDYCYNTCDDGNMNGVLFAGCADGVVRAFECGKDDGGGRMKGMGSVAAHTSQIHCLAVNSFGKDDSTVLVATGSMDQTLVTHLYNNSDKSGLDLHAVYSGGHGNSIGSVTMCNNAERVVMASGDWDGGLVIWNVPSSESNEEDNGESSGKRQKGNSKKKQQTTQPESIREVKPVTSTKAHSSNISGLCFGYQSPTTLLTSSWDHSLKVYDVERMDCILTTNGSRVLTSMSRCMNGNIVGTGCADNMVRLWDMRVGNNGGNVGSMGQIADKTLRQRWVVYIFDAFCRPFVHTHNLESNCCSI
jgi:ribosome biogenesis protein YTM1